MLNPMLRAKPVNRLQSTQKTRHQALLPSVLWRVLMYKKSIYDKQYFTNASCTPSSLFEVVTALAAALTSTGELSIAIPIPA